MKVVLREPNKPATVVTVSDRVNEIYLDLKHLVDERADALLDIAVRAHGMLNGFDLVVYCDDEGLLKQLPLNFYRPTDQSPIVGNIVAVKTDPSTGDEVDMTEAELETVRVTLDTWAKYSANLEKEIN